MVRVHCKEIAETLKTTPDALITRKQAQQIVSKYKSSHCCEICGRTGRKYLTFHHTNPIKKYMDISELVHANRGRRKMPIWSLKREMCKCELLCRDCHDKLHNMK